MDYHETMAYPKDFTFTDAGGVPTAAGGELIRQMQQYASRLESNFSGLYTAMQERERFWKLVAERFGDPRDNALNQYLPSVANPSPKILVSRLVRSVTKDDPRFRVPVGADWTEDQRKTSQAYERYLAGAFYMADSERAASGLGPAKHALTTFLALRGAGVALPFVRSRPRMKTTPDPYGNDHPFSLRSPDPLECAWDSGGIDYGCFVHHNFRTMGQFYGKPWMGTLTESKQQKGMCESYNVWWMDAGGDVWNATSVENCFLVSPTNHTKARGLSSLPCYTDSAYGAPQELRLDGSMYETMRHLYESALDINLNGWRIENQAMAIELQLLRDAALQGIVINSRKSFTEDQIREFLTRQAPMMLNPEAGERVDTLRPVEMSQSVRLLQEKLRRWDQMGGMPDTAGTTVPEGLSALAAAEIQLAGDFKAGPLADALARLYCESAKCFTTQHAALRRKIKVTGVDQQRKSFVETFDFANLPKPGDFMLEVIVKPYLVKDRFRDMQTALTARNAGFSRLSVFDEYTDDPTEEEARTVDEFIKADPGVQALEAARRCTVNGRPDLAGYFMLKARMALGMDQGGQLNPPRAGADPSAGLLPDEQGMAVSPPESIPPVPIDPTTQLGQQMMGQMGSRNGAGGY